MAWANSGLYAASLAQTLSAGANAPNWAAATNRVCLTNNSDSTLYAAALGATGNIFSATNEVFGTGWATGGILVSAAAAGSTSLAPTVTVSGTSPVLMVYGATNLSVATTTLAGAYGAYIYQPTASFQYKIVGIYFGGSSYSTTAGTFAITWASGQVATISVATNT